MASSRAVDVFERSVDRVSEFANTRMGWRVIVCALLLAACGATTWYVSADIDLFTRVATGRLIAQLGEVPLSDPWAYTPRKGTWHEHELIPCVLFYLFSQHGGDTALFALKLAFAVATLMLVFLAQRSAGNATATGLALIALALPDMLSVWLPTVRAQVITYICFAFFLFAFVRARFQGDRCWLLLLPFYEVLWVNSHGGFIVGIIFSTVFTLQMLIEGKHSRLMIISWVGVLLAPLANMYGWSFLFFIFGAVTNLPTEINEWFALRPWTGHGVLVYGITAIVALGLSAWRRIPCEGIVFIGLSALEGFRHERLSPLYTIALSVYGVPLFAEGLLRIRTYWPGFWPILRRSFVASCVLLTAVCGVRLLYVAPQLAKGFQLDYSDYPVAAIDWLRESRPGGTIMTHYNEGSYTLWRIGSQFRISLDGRYDGVYPPETIRMGLEAYEGPTPAQRAALKSFNPDYVLLSPSTPGLCDDQVALREAMYPGYTLAFSDKRFCILERGERASGGPVVTSYPQKIPIWAPLW